MKWYKDLYLGYNILENKQKIIDDINNGVAQFNKYVLALPFNNTDIIDIYPSYVLLQERFRNSDIIIIGLAEGEEEAKDMMQLAIMDCYNATGGFDLKSFICKDEEFIDSK